MAKSTQNMPAIDLGAVELTAGERQIAERILNGGRLRASKPKIEYSIGLSKYGTKIRKPDEIGGKAAYLWRMVAFSISPIAQHHCMPCMAFCDLPERENREDRRALEVELDALAKKIVDSVPKTAWHGVRRWANAFGIGQPQLAADGAIIYR